MLQRDRSRNREGSRTRDRPSKRVWPVHTAFGEPHEPGGPLGCAPKRSSLTESVVPEVAVGVPRPTSARETSHRSVERVWATV